MTAPRSPPKQIVSILSLIVLVQKQQPPEVVLGAVHECHTKATVVCTHCPMLVQLQYMSVNITNNGGHGALHRKYII